MLLFRLISAVAFFAMVALLCLKPQEFFGADGKRQNLFSCALCVCSFFFIPMGSLPAYFTICGSAFIFIALLLASLGLFEKNKKSLAFSTVLYFFLLILLYYARELGFPGDAFSLDLLSSVCLWQKADFLCKLLSAVVSLLFCAFCCYFARGKSNVAFVKLYVTSLCAVLVSFAMPFSVGLELGFTGAKLYLVDFVCFWVEVILLRTVLLKISAANR